MPTRHNLTPLSYVEETTTLPVACDSRDKTKTHAPYTGHRTPKDVQLRSTSYGCRCCSTTSKATLRVDTLTAPVPCGSACCACPCVVIGCHRILRHQRRDRGQQGLANKKNEKRREASKQTVFPHHLHVQRIRLTDTRPAAEQVAVTHTLPRPTTSPTRPIAEREHGLCRLLRCW